MTLGFMHSGAAILTPASFGPAERQALARVLRARPAAQAASR